MELQQRISAFVQLGSLFQDFGAQSEWRGYASGLNEEEYLAFDELVKQARIYNGWFTEENVRHALAAYGEALTLENLEKWLAPYRDQIEAQTSSKKIAVIMAGNIPLVGFHDLLTVLLSGNEVLGKLSGQDDKLMPAVVSLLSKLAPDLASRVTFEEGRMQDFQAVIATGSDNTARYFHTYFGKYPNIIRKNRTSVAVLNGEESENELKHLANDMFRYFGLGCRNVSKIYVPEGYNLDHVFGAIFDWQHLATHNKFSNNYDYHKALFLMNQDKVIENGFVLFKEDSKLTSPVGMMFYEYYSDRNALNAQLAAEAEKIQCIVAKDQVPFGAAQSPALWDYADGVDTMEFLLKL